MKSHRSKHARHSSRELHPNAAGIDVGSASHYVAVPHDRDPRPVRTFGAFTEELFANRRLAERMSHHHRSDGGHGRVLDPAVRDPRAAGV